MNDGVKKRLDLYRAIPKIAQLDHRNTKYFDRAIKEKLSRNERRQVKKLSKKLSKKITKNYSNILLRLHKNPLGFETDKQIRQMAIEYNNRFASAGTQSQPANFNLFEPFLHLHLIKGTSAPYVDIAKEHFHQFDIIDFLEFFTTNEFNDLSSHLQNLSEDQIFHFNVNGDISRYSFFDENNIEYIVSGFSLIRRDNSIHWYLVGGVIGNERAVIDIEERFNVKVVGDEYFDAYKRKFLSETIKKTGSDSGEIVNLKGHTNCPKIVASGQIDILNLEHIVKGFIYEAENSWPLICDDHEIYNDASKFDLQDIIEIQMNNIKDLSVFWNLAEWMVHLPSYFEFRNTISNKLIDSKFLRATKGGRGTQSVIEVIPATANDPKALVAPALRRFDVPHFKTSCKGHWRKIDPKQPGRDRSGNVVYGKTWVFEENLWKEIKDRDKKLYLKDRIAASKIRIDEAIAMTEQSPRSSGKGAGELYILRCAAFQNDLFKVGCTLRSAEERAKELSSSSGVPLAFSVCRVWRSNNAFELEAEVHAALEPYRYAPNREYFSAPLQVIERVIQNTMARTSNNQDS